MKTGSLYADIPGKPSAAPATRRHLTIMKSKEADYVPDWEDIAISCAFITKAIYYAGIENGKGVVTTVDVIEWLKRHNYKIENAIVRNILNTLCSTGIVSRYSSLPLESWEWQLKELV